MARRIKYWLLGLTLGASLALAVFDATNFDPDSFANGSFDFGDTTVAVPDVVGLDVAVAGTALVADNLVTGDLTEQCSNEVDDEVLAQNPIAGTVVLLNTEVDLTVSTGVACVFDLTGIPIGWSSVSAAKGDKEFVALMMQEADGDAVWAYWRAGTEVSPRGSANVILNEQLIRDEADGAAVWGRWAPGAPHNSANLQLDMRAALNVDFVLSP